MSVKNLTYKIGADYSELRREMEGSNELTRKAQRELAALEAKQRQHRQTLTDLGTGFAAFGAAVTLGLAVAGKAAMDWESAFTGVRKTVDGSPQQIAALEAELRKLARTLPASHEEIAKVAEAAGQLGIKRQDIAQFTKVMIDLGNTTNLTAEDAATGLAKLSNIMGTSSKDVDRLGSALVALGNDGASTEADILAMALRIAGAGHTIGLSEAQVLGFASALSSVGIEAEAGGSSISRVMITIEQAVRAGGKAVQGFADVTGLSADEFVKKYKDDAAGAITAFIAGLSRMQAAGGNVFATLEELGFGEILVRDALLRTAGASDMLTKSLKVGTSAWAENKALTDEASKRYETSASKLQVAGNQIKDALIDVGAAIAPAVVAGAQAISDIVRAFQALPGPVKEVVTWVGVATAVVGVFGGAALIAVPKVLAFRESMTALMATGGGMSTALGRMGLFLSGPWGVALGAGVATLGLFAAMSGAAGRKQQELEGDLREVAKALREQNGVANESIRLSIAKAAQDSKWAGGQKNVLSAAKALKVETGLITDAILNQGSAYDTVAKQLDSYIRAGAGALKKQARGEFLTSAEKDLANQAGAAQVLKGKLDELRGTFKGQVDAENEVAGATKGATEAAKGQAGATDEVKSKAEEAADALSDLVDAFNKLNGITLTYREAQRSYIEAVQAAGEALAANGKTLDINTAAGRANASALDDQAQAANDLAEAAARQAEKTGGAAAGAAALKASLDASRPALIETAIKFGMSRDEAVKYADSVLAIPTVASTNVLTPGAQQAQAELIRVRDAVKGVPPNTEVNVGVLSSEAIAKLNEVGFKTRTLPDGTVVVVGNTKPAQDSLDNLIRNNQGKTIGIRVNIGGIDGLRIGGQNVLSAFGNVVAFGHGGTWEDHAPQVVDAQPGTMRVWAEPETDRESYIPWAKDRRPRALGVLGYTADGFGYALTPKAQMSTFTQASAPAAAAAQPAVNFPSTVTLVDQNGSLLGHMRVVADQAVQTEGRELFLKRGRG